MNCASNIMTRNPIAAMVLSPYVMTNDNSLNVQRKGRKRQRNMDGRHASLLFCVLIGFIKCTVGQTYYNSCFDQIRNADDNEDLLLSKEEYSKFLITISGGAILLQNETPPILSNPYTLRQKGTSQQLNISGTNPLSTFTAQNEMASFCQQVYSGLASIFNIKVEVKACTDSFRMSDSDPPNDALSTNEYAFFVVNISKDVSLINYEFEELPNAIKDVFNDMGVDGEIPKSRGEQYLVRFCERAAIAAQIGEIVYATMPTETPSEASPTKKPTSKFNPTKAPASSPVPLSEEHSKCKTGLIVSDLNRNSLLESDEYSNFLEELSDKTVSAVDFSNLDIIFQDVYSNLINSNDDAINLGGFRPGLTPSTDEYENLLQICNQTFNAIARYEAKAASPSLSPALNSNSTDLSEIELKTCTKFMVLSDTNRNSILEDSEFVTFVSRLTTAQDFSNYEFTDLDIKLRQIYEGTSSAVDGINIDGSKPGQEATQSQEKLFQALCTAVYSAIEELEAIGPNTKVPMPQSSPSQAPSVTMVEISDEFFRVCKTAMLVADRNRDDVLEAEEYVRFLNRLTISEFSGEVFADLEPALQIGFRNVAIDGKVNVYGSKPGTTSSPEEQGHLRHVCESAHAAIERYQSDTQKFDCETKLQTADRNSDHELDKSEYVVYIRSITGINYSTFDALPYLLRDQYEWFRLGKSTINIFGLVHQSVSLPGDKVRISWICDHTSHSLELLSKFGNDTNFTDYCDVAIQKADNNTDGFLDDDEFITLIDAFEIPLSEQHRYNLSVIDRLFSENFERFKDPELNLVDVKTAKSKGLCDGLANATNNGRELESLFRICADSLRLSDIDGNGRLNQTEYIPFIDTLVTAYNLTISASGDFEGLKSNDSGIDIRGLYAESSFEEFTTLREVCTTTGYAFGIIKNIDEETVTIYNSFSLSNEAGFKAENLPPESDERRGLEKAYAAFVEYEVRATVGSHGRFLILQGAALNESKVYQIVDGICPTGSNADEKCLTAFASFNVTVASDDESSISTNHLLSNKTQDAIDRGTLQLMLSTVDPNSTLKVLKSSQPLTPEEDTGDDFEFVDEPTNDGGTTTSSEGGKVASLAVIAGAAVGASVVGAALFFLFVSKQKKSKASNISEKEVIEVDGISARKPSGNFDDNLLEEGRKASVNRFIFSTHRIEDDGTCGFSESNVTNNSSFRNATENIPSTKSDNENEVSTRSIHADQINYVNPNFTFKINDDSESSVGPEGDEVDDKGDSAVELFPVHSFSATPIVPASSTEYVSNEMGIQDCIRENGFIGSTNDGLNLPYDKDDDSDSFEEVEIGSDDELEENLRAETGESSQKKSHDFHESFSIEEYEDASDEEIEISVHDDVEDEAISEIECEDTNENVVLDDREPPVEAEKNLVGSKFEVESRSKLPELSIDVEENSQNATDTESDDDNVDMKKEVEVAESDDDEESESEEEVEEEF